MKYRVRAIRPLGIHLLVMPVEQAAPQGRLIAEVRTTDEAPSIGVIVALGPGGAHPGHGLPLYPPDCLTGGMYARDGDMDLPDLSVGDILLYRKYAGQEVYIEDARYLMLTPDDILGFASCDEVPD